MLTFNTMIADVSVALKAINLYQNARYKDAINELQCILDFEPTNWDARLMLAACLYKTAQYPAAERAFQFIANKTTNAELRRRAEEGVSATRDKMDKWKCGESALPAEFGLYVDRISRPTATQGPNWLLN
jgi:hypothetical protein